MSKAKAKIMPIERKFFIGTVRMEIVAYCEVCQAERVSQQTADVGYNTTMEYRTLSYSSWLTADCKVCASALHKKKQKKYKQRVACARCEKTFFDDDIYRRIPVEKSAEKFDRLRCEECNQEADAVFLLKNLGEK